MLSVANKPFMLHIIMLIFVTDFKNVLLGILVYWVIIMGIAHRDRLKCKVIIFKDGCL
jgi:Na+/melibiose symporter-like transporter